MKPTGHNLGTPPSGGLDDDHLVGDLMRDLMADDPHVLSDIPQISKALNTQVAGATATTAATYPEPQQLDLFDKNLVVSAAPLIIEQKPFVLTSSYGPSSPEVKRVATVSEQEGGIPIYLYELMQGQVDYGRRYDPPPRIIIEYKSGRREEFRGKSFDNTKEDPVVALEFTNRGKGLTPEDTVINRHDGGEEDTTLGMHGKGMTLALSYMNNRGMPVQVRSHHLGVPWKGKTSLQATETGVARVLRLDGQWGKKGEELTTVFRLENPTSRACQDLARAGEYFLYANPKFPDAVLVPPDAKEAPSSFPAIAIGNGTVQCVEGVVPPPKNDKSYDFIFVDGLRIKPGWTSAVLAWSIVGLSNPGQENHRFMVKRGHDSTSLHSGSSPGAAIALAFRSLQSKALLAKVIREDEKHPSRDFMELGRGAGELPVAPETARLVKEIWKEDFADATVDFSPERIRWHKTSSKEQVKLVSKELYAFLKASGVRTLDGNTGVKEVHTLDYVSPLKIPSVFQPDGFEQFMERLAAEGAEIDKTTLAGKRYLRIRIPQLIKSAQEFSGQSEERGGVLLRTAAALAHFKKIPCRTFSLELDHLNEVSMKTNVDPYTKTIGTEVGFLVFDRAQYPEFKTYPNGCTYILFPEENLQPAAETLIGEFKKAIALFKKRGKKGPNFHLRGEDGSDATRTSWDITGLDNLAKIIMRSGVGQIPIFMREALEDRQREAREAFERDTVMPKGYYQKGVGTTFVYDPDRRRAEWQSAENWAYEDVPQKTPKQFSAKLRIQKLHGEQRLLVKCGEKIVGFESEGVGRTDSRRSWVCSPRTRAGRHPHVGGVLE